MTDQQRESSIADMGLLMTSAYARYELTKLLRARGLADGYRIAMERLIGQRTAEQVARMEANRGMS